MDIPRTIGYTEIVKIAECALNGDSERARVFLKRYIGKYPDKDLVYPFTHLLNGVTNPSGLNSNITPACEGKADSTSEKDLRVCEVSGSLFSDSEILDWLQIAMSPNSNYCELYLAGLRNFESDYAQAFQIESCPEKFKTVNAPTLREAVSLAMIAYNDR